MSAANSGHPRELIDEVPLRFSLRRLLLWIVLISMGLAALKACHNAIQIARREAVSNGSQSTFNYLQYALRNYHQENGEFPPAYVADVDGKPMHSWRVLMLPYIEEQALYAKYRFNEPWNGPNNSKLADQMPQTFRVASEPHSTTYTNVVAMVGEGTAFPGSKSTKLADFKDGTGNTILLAEISDSRIPWMQPCDLDAAKLRVPVSNNYQPEISSVFWRRPFVVFADRIGTYSLSENLPPDSLRALCTIAGGEPVTRDSLLTEGYLAK